MSKKLLSEAQIRRFAKLASLPAINERWGSKEDEYKRRDVGGVEKKAGDIGGHYKTQYQEQDETGFEEIEGEVDAALPPGEEVEMAPGEEEIEMAPGEGEEIEMEVDLGDPEAVATEIFTAIADVLGVEIDVGGDVGELGGEEEVLDDTGIPDDIGGLEGEDTEIVDDEEEEMLQEALAGITYVPGQKEIVNEVAKRVARRLVKAKRAEKNLKEALSTQTPPRRKRPQRRK